MCKHRYMENFGDRSFRGAEAVRLCVQCDHAEALVDGAWVDFNRYLESLGPSIEEVDTVVTSRPTSR
jgi:hypothetical protein